MSIPDDILQLIALAHLHQEDELITTIHARILHYWPDWHIATPAALKAKIARLRMPSEARGDRLRLTPVRQTEIQHGYTYLAASFGQTTGLFKLVTATTPKDTFEGYNKLFRIDHE